MSQDKIQKARELVLNYIATHSLSDKLNRAVNEVCRSRPKDPWLFLSDIISEWTKDVPIIDRLVAKQGIDSYGNLSLQLQLYGRVANARPPRYLGIENVFIINNNEQEMNEENDDNEEIKDNNNELNGNYKSMMKKISEFLSPALRSIRIDQQKKIDLELLKLYDDGLQQESKRFNIIPTISTLIAITTSNYLRMPLYKYLNKINNINQNENENENENENDEENNNYIIPNIMCQLTKSISNKLPSICIITKSILIPIERIKMIKKITNEFIKIIGEKPVCFDKNTGSILLNDNDCSDIDQLLLMINNAINNCKKYKIGRDLSLCLSFLNNPTCIKYDLQTQKYKNYNNQDINIINYFNDLLTKYKEIEYLEDPLNENDQETYSLLNNKIINNVTIIGNQLYSSLHQLIENGIKKKLTNAAFIKTSEMFTITNVLNLSNMINNNKNNFNLMISDNYNDNCLSSYSVDLSLASNAKILRLSLPNSVKSINKYNRWLILSQNDDDDSSINTMTMTTTTTATTTTTTNTNAVMINGGGDDDNNININNHESTKQNIQNNDNDNNIVSDDKTEEALP